MPAIIPSTELTRSGCGELLVDSGSSYFNFGWGDPTFYFSPDSARGIGQSAAATADGLIPFADPFASHGFYDPCDKWNRFSHAMGQVAQASLTSAAGLGAVRAANGFLMPSTLYHFTSAEGAAGIAATGGIEAGSGLYGTGVYLSGFNSASNERDARQDHAPTALNNYAKL